MISIFLKKVCCVFIIIFIVITLQLVYLNIRISQKLDEAEHHQRVTDISLEALSRAGDQTLTDIRDSFDRHDLNNSQYKLGKYITESTFK
jgi:uncharacterized membrane protein